MCPERETKPKKQSTQAWRVGRRLWGRCWPATIPWTGPVPSAWPWTTTFCSSVLTREPEATERHLRSWCPPSLGSYCLVNGQAWPTPHRSHSLLPSPGWDAASGKGSPGCLRSPATPRAKTCPFTQSTGCRGTAVPWAELCLQKDTATSYPPVPAHVTGSGERVFADVIKDVRMKSPWTYGGPEPTDRCPYGERRESWDTQTDKEKAIWPQGGRGPAVCLQVKEGQRRPPSPGSEEAERPGQVSLSARGISGFRPPKKEERRMGCCFSHPACGFLLVAQEASSHGEADQHLPLGLLAERGAGHLGGSRRAPPSRHHSSTWTLSEQRLPGEAECGRCGVCCWTRFLRGGPCVS